MLFQFIREQVSNVTQNVSQQQQITSGVLDQIKASVPRIKGSWIGGDADEYESDVARKVVPAMVELIAAIAGINLNLNKATSLIDQADSKVKGLASGLGDVFSQIF